MTQERPLVGQLPMPLAPPTARARHSAAGIATALLGGDWTAVAMARRVRDAAGLARTPRWAGPLVEQVLTAYPDAPADRPDELTGFLLGSGMWSRRLRSLHVIHWAPATTRVVRSPWPVTRLDDLGALARLLDLDQGELAWFADLRGWERSCLPALRHYTWHEVAKRGGTRLVAAPKPRMKEIQRRLLRHVLAPIPVHPAAHGCVPGRSVRTALEPHVGTGTVIRVDLSSFFASVPAARVRGVLDSAGLPEPVARTVTGLLTTVAPREISRDPALRTPHLPQGAPTSPQSANLVAFALDRRLAGLAAQWGGSYSRYVDDLVFSGGTRLRAGRSRLLELITEIVDDEGFAVNERKTVVLGAAGRQQVLGAVVNAAVGLPRGERDALRATLHNCVVRGWAAQAAGRERDEYRNHLQGRVAWAAGLNPGQGRRLRAIYEQIDWTTS